MVNFVLLLFSYTYKTKSIIFACKTKQTSKWEIMPPRMHKNHYFYIKNLKTFWGVGSPSLDPIPMGIGTPHRHRRSSPFIVQYAVCVMGLNKIFWA